MYLNRYEDLLYFIDSMLDCEKQMFVEKSHAVHLKG